MVLGEEGQGGGRRRRLQLWWLWEIIIIIIIIIIIVVTGVAGVPTTTTTITTHVSQFSLFVDLTQSVHKWQLFSGLQATELLTTTKSLTLFLLSAHYWLGFFSPILTFVPHSLHCPTGKFSVHFSTKLFVHSCCGFPIHATCLRLPLVPFTTSTELYRSWHMISVVTKCFRHLQLMLLTVATICTTHFKNQKVCKTVYVSYNSRNKKRIFH